MLFGSIAYLNLLPFQLFLKRHLKSSSEKIFLHYKGGEPSRINHALKQKKIDAGFISSVTSARFKCTNLGIIGYKKVYSVLLLAGEDTQDPASATSNALAKVLGLEGRVLIGDKALQYYLSGGQAQDLAEVWYEQTGLPFVFGRLCYNQKRVQIEQLAKAFAKQKTKIPQYILKREAKKREITPKQLTLYLRYISYTIGWKEQRGLTLFLQKTRKTRKMQKRRKT